VLVVQVQNSHSKTMYSLVPLYHLTRPAMHSLPTELWSHILRWDAAETRGLLSCLTVCKSMLVGCQYVCIHSKNDAHTKSQTVAEQSLYRYVRIRTYLQLPRLLLRLGMAPNDPARDASQ
jgi:hypothetical protein